MTNTLDKTRLIEIEITYRMLNTWYIEWYGPEKRRLLRVAGLNNCTQ
jgi:hypothetical protein